MAMIYELHKVGHSLCGTHWAYEIRSIGDVNQPYKVVTYLWVNIKPTRPIISILRVHQVYKVSQDYQEAAAQLIAK